MGAFNTTQSSAQLAGKPRLMAHLGPGKGQTQLIDLHFCLHLGAVWRADGTGSLWSPQDPQNHTVNGLLLLRGLPGAHKASQINPKRRSLP